MPAVQASFDGTLPVVQTKKEREKMTEATPKIEGAKKFHRSTRAAGPIKKEFITKVLGLESHTFDIGNVKYAAKYKKTVDAIANHIQRKYKDGADGQNRNPGVLRRSDTRNPCGISRGNLGVARLGISKRLAGATRKREARE